MVEARFRRTVLATCCVPWAADGSFLEDIFRHGVADLAAAGVRDLYVFGTAGEGYAVTERQFDAIARAFVDEAGRHGVTPMVGVTSLSLATMLERIERAAGWGVREFQVTLPSWGTLNAAELQAFFTAVCGRFPELSFLHYNLPRAGRVVTPGEYAALIGDHPNLVGTKFGAMDLRAIVEYNTKVPQLRHFHTELGFAHGSLVGAPGLIPTLTTVKRGMTRALFEAGVARDTERLMALTAEYWAARDLMMASADAGPHMDGAYDKLFCKLLDERFPLRLLPPYQGASDAWYERLRAALREQMPEWLATA